MQANTQSQGWHVAQWGTWGWAETILKLVAIVAGIAAFVRTLSAGGLILSGNSHLAAVILLALLTLAALAQIAIRFTQRETISFVFAILNLLGHLALLIALLRVPSERGFSLLFAGFWLLGELTKLQFLRVTGYTEGGANTSGMLRTTAVIAVLYALLAVLILL